MKKKNSWIVEGYNFCSTNGFDNIRVEQLAKNVGISKSSFYHYFSDVEGFKEHLTNYHLEQCAILAEKEKNCEELFPDLINILLEHKTDILFHRQLRINRKNEQLEQALNKSIQILGNYSLMLWAKDINHNLSQLQLEGLFKIATDDFYMRINENNLNSKYLNHYFKELGSITNQLIR